VKIAEAVTCWTWTWMSKGGRRPGAACNTRAGRGCGRTRGCWPGRRACPHGRSRAASGDTSARADAPAAAEQPRQPQREPMWDPEEDQHAGASQLQHPVLPAQLTKATLEACMLLCSEPLGDPRQQQECNDAYAVGFTAAAGAASAGQGGVSHHLLFRPCSATERLLRLVRRNETLQLVRRKQHHPIAAPLSCECCQRVAPLCRYWYGLHRSTLCSATSGCTPGLL
jgi:hypothetical protein